MRGKTLDCLCRRNSCCRTGAMTEKNAGLILTQFLNTSEQAVNMNYNMGHSSLGTTFSDSKKLKNNQTLEPVHFLLTLSALMLYLLLCCPGRTRLSRPQPQPIAVCPLMLISMGITVLQFLRLLLFLYGYFS